jgi:hypothetical protein
LRPYALGRISRHSPFDVVIAVRTDNFMSLNMIKDAVEALSRRWWISSIRQRFGAVSVLATCSRAVRCGLLYATTPLCSLT